MNWRALADGRIRATKFIGVEGRFMRVEGGRGVRYSKAEFCEAQSLKPRVKLVIAAPSRKGV